MRGVGSFLQFVGGSVGRAAGTALAVGIFFVVYGVMPWEFVAGLIQRPPPFVGSVWFKPAVVIVGLATIAASLWFNLWSKKQQAIDELAEDISWAIRNLLNRKPRPKTEEEIAAWQADFREWCSKVSRKLENRAFFTRADQLHFEMLGFVDAIAMSGSASLDNLLGQLKMKFERLRDIINWVQIRRR